MFTISFHFLLALLSCTEHSTIYLTVLKLKPPWWRQTQHRPSCAKNLDIHVLIHPSFTSISSCTPGLKDLWGKGRVTLRKSCQFHTRAHGKTYTFIFILTQNWVPKYACILFNWTVQTQWGHANATKWLARQPSCSEVTLQTTMLFKMTLTFFWNRSLWDEWELLVQQAEDVKVLWRPSSNTQR